MQWADEGSLRLFSALAHRFGNGHRAPILVLGAFRSHENVEDQQHGLNKVVNEVRRLWGDVVIDLDAAPQEERRRFTRALIQASGLKLDVDAEEELFRRTQGNALYLIELIRLMSQGPIREGLDWSLLPARVEGALSERMRSIQKEPYSLAELAAVIGIDFSAQLLAEASSRSIDEIIETLMPLVQPHGIVVDRGVLEGASGLYGFSFAEPSYQKHIYDSISPSRRALMHKRAGEALLHLYKGTEGAIAQTAAEHFRRAGDLSLAVPLLDVAAHAEIRSGSPVTAERLATAGLEILAASGGDFGHLGSLELAKGSSLVRLRSKYPEAEKLLRSAVDNAMSPEDRAHALIWLGSCLWHRNKLHEAVKTLRSGLRHARETGNRSLEQRALRNLGVVERRLGDPAAALDHYEEAERIAEDLQLPYSVSACMNNRAVILSVELGDTDSAITLRREAIRVARESGNTVGEALYMRNLAQNLFSQGRVEAAESEIRGALRLAEEHGLAAATAAAHSVLGNFFLKTGRFAEATAELEKSLEQTSKAGNDPTPLTMSRLALAYALNRSPNRENESLRLASSAVEKSRPRSLRGTVITPDIAMSLIHLSYRRPADSLLALPDLGQVIPSGTDPWAFRWRAAINAILRSLLAPEVSSKCQPETRLRLAKAASDDFGARSAFSVVLGLGEEVFGPAPTLVATRHILEEPLQRRSAVSSYRSDVDRINRLTANLSAVRSRTASSRYRVPTNLEAERKSFLSEYAQCRPRDPVFDYEQMAANLEAPLVEFLSTVDPSRSVWEERIFESVEDSIALLRATRTHGGTSLAEASRDTYGIPSESLVHHARSLLRETLAPSAEVEDRSADDARELFRAALEVAGLGDWDVTIVPAMVARMSAKPAARQIRIRANAMFSVRTLHRLLVHEIGTHVFTGENGRRQAIQALATGLGRTASTQEGLAAYNEDRFGVGNERVMRRYALRVLAVDEATRSGFTTVFESLCEHTTPEEAFEITVRVKRGMKDTSQPGGFLKDHVYLNGLVHVRSALSRHPEDYEILMAGKFPLDLLPVMRTLAGKGLLNPPQFLPESLLPVIEG